MTPNFESLELVVKATELLPLGGFNMDYVRFESWFCGTVGCMIGNYNHMIGRQPNKFSDCFGDGPPDCVHFGITQLEYDWLFADSAYEGVYDCDDSDVVRLSTDWAALTEGEMQNITREQALARLRKFIAYKRRKHALIHDPKYGVSEAARRAEGNQNFVMLAVAEVKEAMALATAT